MSPLSTPGLDTTLAAEASSSAAPNASTEPNDTSSIASPFKKQRASLPGFDDGVRRSLGQAIMGAQKEHRGNSESQIPTIETKMEEDEEL